MRTLALVAAAVLVIGVLWLLRERRSAEPHPLGTEVVGDRDAALDVPSRTEPGRREDAAAPSEPEAAELHTEGALLRLALVDERGAPLEGQGVYLWSPDDDELDTSERGERSRGLEGDEVFTDARGRVELTLVAGKRYGLTGGDDAGRADPAGLERELVLAPGETRELTISLATAWLRTWCGRVIDGETRLPVADALVEARTARDQRLDPERALCAARTDGEGRVRLVLPTWLSAHVLVTAEGRSPQAEHGDAGAVAPETAQTLEVWRPARLDVLVLDAQGSPAPGLDLCAGYPSIWPRGGAEVEWRAETDERGRCSLARLPARVPLEVWIARGEQALLHPFGAGSGFLELQPGTRKEVELRLERTLELVGRVVDQDGAPLADVPLILSRGPAWLVEQGLLTADGWSRLREECTPFARTRSDEQGRFAFAGVAAGAWTLAADAEEVEDLPGTPLWLRVEPGAARKEVELRLDRGLWIRGVVLDPEGSALRGVQVVGAGPYGPLPWDTSRRDGTFALGPLLAGSYRIRAEAGDDPRSAPSETVELAAGSEGVVLRQRWGGIVSGRVVDQEERAVEAEVVLVGDGRSRHATDEFEFENLAPGSYALLARNEQGIAVLEPILVRAQERPFLLVRLEPPCRLVVRTEIPGGEVFLLEVHGRGLPLHSGMVQGSSTVELAVPSGEVRAVFSRRSLERTPVHEEQGFARPGTPLVLEWTPR